MTTWYDFPITHGYIDTYQGANTDTPHFAEDFGTPQDTPLYFLESGTIVIEDQQDWGGEIFLKPDSGNPEEYFYHLDKFANYKVGDHVNAGDIIGYSGGQNTGGTMNTAPQWSTGPHTHFGEFTNYAQTPVGSRPYGPSPDALIQNAQAQGLQGTGQPLALANSSQPSSSNPLDAISSMSSFFSNLQQNSVRIGFFAIGGLVALIGIYSMVK